jgi:hypothetical protein
VTRGRGVEDDEIVGTPGGGAPRIEKTGGFDYRYERHDFVEPRRRKIEQPFEDVAVVTELHTNAARAPRHCTAYRRPERFPFELERGGCVNFASVQEAVGAWHGAVGGPGPDAEHIRD